jgi:GNAT superfamily N-acetyltransferase
MVILCSPSPPRRIFLVTPITLVIDILKWEHRRGQHAVQPFRLSYARKGDINLLAEHRKRMWLEIRPEYEREVRATGERTRKWIGDQLSKGSLVGLVVRTADGEVVGSGCIWLREEQPRPTNMRLVVPYLMSMYTVKRFRRRGVASLIVKGALKWCKANNFDIIVLHASEEGREVYEGLGFEPSNEMRFRFLQ